MNLHEQEITVPEKDTLFFYCFSLIEVNNAQKSFDEDLKVKDIMYELQGKFSKFV